MEKRDDMTEKQKNLSKSPTRTEHIKHTLIQISIVGNTNINIKTYIINGEL